MKTSRKLLGSAVVAAAAIALGTTAAVHADDKAVDPASVELDMAAASAIALGAVPGSVTEAELEDEDGVIVWEMEILAEDGKEYEVTIDANSGSVLETELDD